MKLENSCSVMRDVSRLAGVALIVSSVSAAEPTKAQLDFFESRVRPVLADKCYKCHSEKAEKIACSRRACSSELPRKDVTLPLFGS